MENKNVEKRKPRPKRSIKRPGEDHPLGLWIDKDLLRKHHSAVNATIIHNPLPSTNNRYLELADLALGTNGKGTNGKPKKKLRAPVRMVRVREMLTIPKKGQVSAAVALAPI